MHNILPGEEYAFASDSILHLCCKEFTPVFTDFFPIPSPKRNGQAVYVYASIFLGWRHGGEQNFYIHTTGSIKHRPEESSRLYRTSNKIQRVEW